MAENWLLLLWSGTGLRCVAHAALRGRSTPALPSNIWCNRDTVVASSRQRRRSRASRTARDRRSSKRSDLQQRLHVRVALIYPFDSNQMYVIARCATVLALLSLLCAHDAAAAANGVTLSIFNNTALAGAPSTTKTLDTFSVTIPSSGAPFSAEAVAALSLPGEEGGLFTFSCEFTGVTTAFFWVDDHLVCQSGAYEWGKDGNDTDATLHGLSKRSGLVVRLRLMYNGSTPQPEALARATGAQRTAPRGSDGGAQGGGASVSAGVTWRVWPSAGYVPLPTTLLTTALPAVEVQRASLQDSLAQGWGTWMHNSVMDVVLLPEASRVTVALCQLSSGRCLSSAVFEDKDTIRAGPIAYDGSYAQYYVWFDSVNVSVSISADPTQRASGAPLNILVEPQSCNGNCSDYAVAFLGSFGWFRAGAVTASAELGQLVLDAYNLRTSSAFVATSAGGSSPPSAVSLPANATTLPYVAVALQETVSVSLNVGERRIPTASVAAAISTARAAETARYAKYGDLSSAKEAVQAGVMWNVVYTPAEVGGVLAPVARSWTFAPSPVNSDCETPRRTTWFATLCVVASLLLMLVPLPFHGRDLRGV